MVLDTQTRMTYLKRILEQGKPCGREKLFYQGKTQEFDVYRIDLNYLIYNRHNGRIEVEMLTWEQENSISYDGYSQELHSKIDDFLWESNKGRNKSTLKDLKAKGQQKSGIVSLDGVVIDGNRRSMLLRRIYEETNQQQFLDAIILPQAYADSQEDIVRMETQYQLGEDAKVEYGALQKYLHVRRLHVDLGIPLLEVDDLMGEKNGTAQRLLGIMDLMDEYLEYIGCSKLYMMLKDSDGTKEGMFVDLYQDLKRLELGQVNVDWVLDPDLDPIDLKLLQFDYIRLGDFADAKKVYRNISHSSQGKNFFSNGEIWREFRERHEANIRPINTDPVLTSLEGYISLNSDKFNTKMDAARARDEEWRERVQGHMKGNFKQADYKLDLAKEVLEPGEYLRRARDQLTKIKLDNIALYTESGNREIINQINAIVWDIKKGFDRNSYGK